MHACFRVVVLMNHKMVAMFVFIVFIEIYKGFDWQSWNLWRCFSRCGCEMVLEVCQMVVNLCLAGFHGSERGLDVGCNIATAALCGGLGCLSSL